MANTALHTSNSIMDEQWQNIGPTLLTERKLTSHLRPTNEASIHRPLVNNNNAQRGLNTPSTVALRRAASTKTTPAAKIDRFLRRFSWNKRSKAYVFGKAYLQRQPSFIITPDRSSYSYNFKNRDLVRRKPNPRVWRTSQPIAAWKNSKPMDVLMNQGKVNLPNFMHQNPAQNPAVEDFTKTFVPDANTVENAESSSTAASIPTAYPSSSIPHVPSKAHTSAGKDTVPSDNVAPDTDLDVQRGNWVKISLPVKHNRNSSSSNNEANQNSTSASDSTPHTTATVRSHHSSLRDVIPQTPVDTSQTSKFGDTPREGGFRNGGPTSRPSSAYILDGGYQDPLTGLRSSQAQAQAVLVDSPPSPTSLPSSYRPESWRRSAVVARNSLDAVISDSMDNPDQEFVGAWSSYIRKAVAQRAIDSRQRKSWEMENEFRWSQNLEWESEPEETSSGTSSRTSVYSTSDSASARSGVTRTSVSSSTSNGSNPNDTATPRAVTGQRQNTPLVHTSSPRPKSTSKLAPLNSPRDMASASVVALASPDKRSSFKEVLEEAPQRYTSLFAVRNSPWQPADINTGTLSSPISDCDSTTSSSRFNEDDYIFPTQHTGFPVTGPESSMGPDLTSHHAFKPSQTSNEAEFDFSDRTDASARKRPLSLSPMTTPPQLPRDLPGLPLESQESLSLTPPGLESHPVGSTASLDATEAAPALVRSRSQWNKAQPAPKRIRESSSREVLVHARQKTMESLWGGEDDDDAEYSDN